MTRNARTMGTALTLLALAGAAEGQRFYMIRGGEYSEAQLQREFRAAQARYALIDGRLASVGGDGFYRMSGKVLQVVDTNKLLVMTTAERVECLVLRNGADNIVDGAAINFLCERIGTYQYIDTEGAQRTVRMMRPVQWAPIDWETFMRGAKAGAIAIGAPEAPRDGPSQEKVLATQGTFRKWDTSGQRRR